MRLTLAVNVRLELEDTAPIGSFGSFDASVTIGASVTFAVNKSVAYIRNADGAEHRLRILKKIATRNRWSKSMDHAVGSGLLPLEPMHVDASPAQRFRMFGDDQRVGQWPRPASLSQGSPSQSWPGGLVARSLGAVVRGHFTLRYQVVP